MTESNSDRLRMEALLAALAEGDDKVGEGRRFLLDHLEDEVAEKLGRKHPIHDEPDPMLEAIERDDEHFRLERYDYP